MVREGQVYRSLKSGHRLTVEFVFEQRKPGRRKATVKTLCSLLYPDGREGKRLHVEASSLLDENRYVLIPLVQSEGGGGPQGERASHPRGTQDLQNRPQGRL